MLADRDYDAEWLRDRAKGQNPAFRAENRVPFPFKYDKQRYKRRNRVESCTANLKDWRRVATKHDRCPTVLFWLGFASAEPSQVWASGPSAGCAQLEKPLPHPR